MSGRARHEFGTGKNTGEEIRLLRTHPRFGYNIIHRLGFSQPVADIILQHHERLDGSGYHDGRRGDDMLLPARVLAVADVVEAMASHRPYREAAGLEAALNEISAHAGKLYDPDAVAACVRLFREKGFSFS
jgi:HD-GYP domain-containing protein (c-di-GMP phosphodiesterase class II)